MNENRAIKIVEVGPRDGLQNERVETSTEWKVQLVNQLSNTGLKFIEAGSFVSPKWVPQMADSAEIIRGIEHHDGITYSALTPNLKGLHAALDARVGEVVVFISATEGFSRKNLNCTISQSLDHVAEIVAVADHAKCPVRAYISCVTHCPFDGKVTPVHVASLVDKLIQTGCHEVSLGDTIGKAEVDDISALLDAVLAKTPAKYLAGHFHDTSDNALANIETSLAYGLRTFDASIAGLGGCPFAPGAPGNLDTVKLVNYLIENGFDTGVDVEAINSVASFVNQTIRTH